MRKPNRLGSENTTRSWRRWNDARPTTTGGIGGTVGAQCCRFGLLSATNLAVAANTVPGSHSRCPIDFTDEPESPGGVGSRVSGAVAAAAGRVVRPAATI